MVTAQDGQLTPLAKSVLWDSGVRDFSNVSTAEIDKLEKYFTDRLLNSKKSVKETEVDNAGILAAQKERRKPIKVKTKTLLR
jgi:hypothetical protein